MEPIKVFLSSNYRESTWRETAIETIRNLPGFIPVLVEETAAAGNLQGTIFRNILDADVMVLIVGASLGSPTREGNMFHLELEYAAAKKVGKPVLVMMLGERPMHDAIRERPDQHDVRRITEFRQKLFDSNTIGLFQSNAELRQKLQSALLRIAEDRFHPTFRIDFDPELSEYQVRAVFEALSDYYRACGGIGLSVDFEREEVTVGDLSHV